MRNMVHGEILINPDQDAQPHREDAKEGGGCQQVEMLVAHGTRVDAQGM